MTTLTPREQMHAARALAESIKEDCNAGDHNQAEEKAEALATILYGLPLPPYEDARAVSTTITQSARIRELEAALKISTDLHASTCAELEEVAEELGTLKTQAVPATREAAERAIRTAARRYWTHAHSASDTVQANADTAELLRDVAYAFSTSTPAPSPSEQLERAIGAHRNKYGSESTADTLKEYADTLETAEDE